jgi:hypothetical protein
MELPITKAKRILQERKDIALCVEAGICHRCGSELEKIEKEVRDGWLIDTQCSINAEHYKAHEKIYM